MNEYLEVGCQIWITSNSEKCFAGTLLEINDNNFKVKDQYGNEYPIPKKYVYPYASRVDMIFKRMPEVLRFIHRFDGCDFYNTSYYFAVILQKRFPAMKIYYQKNYDRFICCDEGTIYYNQDGRIFISDTDILVDHSYEYVNNEEYKNEFIKKHFS